MTDQTEYGRFLILCCVSGGVTGTREAYLKQDGTVRVFEKRSEAATVAGDLNKKMNGPYSTASFRYTVVED